MFGLLCVWGAVVFGMSDLWGGKGVLQDDAYHPLPSPMRGGSVQPPSLDYLVG